VSNPVAAVLIAVGSELSSGQIQNTNTAWLAQQLSSVGLEPLLHWTVPDQRELLQQALQSASACTELVILTGGLGPTSDDFTREVLAAHLEQPLELDADSWSRLQARAQRLGFVLTPSQQQQCWFPQGAEVLANPAGTADAFVVHQNPTLFLVLPGPPREVQALWPDCLAHLQAHLPEQPQWALQTWQCLGVSEGSLGEAVDAALAGSGFQTGYRAHFPYIEVKVWSPPGALEPWLPKLMEALKPALVLTGQANPARELLQALPAADPVRLVDTFSAGLLAQRLQELWSDASLPPSGGFAVQSIWPAQNTTQTQPVDLPRSDRECLLVLAPGTASETCQLNVYYQGQQHQLVLQSPFTRRPAFQRAYLTELALIRWKETLNEMFT